MRYALLASLFLTLIIFWGTANARQYLEGNVSLRQPTAVPETLQLAESKLNTTYLKLLNSLEGRAPGKLANAQQTWGKYSVAECHILLTLPVECYIP